MLDLIKRLFFPAFYLGLVTGAHFALLSLVSGHLWIRKFHGNLKFLLMSGLVLSGIYIFLFAVFFFSRRKREQRYTLLHLFLIVAGACFAYLALFSGDSFHQQVSAGVALFSWVSVALVFFQMEKGLPSRIMRYVLAVTLLGVGMTSLYQYKEMFLLLYPKTLVNVPSVEKRFNEEETVINTSFYSVSSTEYSRYDYYIPAKLGNFPSYIGVIDDKNFLVIDRLGSIFHLNLRRDVQHSEAESLYMKLLEGRVPINYQEFYAFDDKHQLNQNKSFFRVHDVYIEKENESGGQRSLYVSHHFWHAREKCFTVRITKLTEDVSVLLQGAPASATWRTLYESSPCFSSIFHGHQAGGRIVGMDENSLLFSLGDHGYDTRRKNQPQNFPQDTDAAYGKIWKIDRDTGEAELVSLGHRNPQGLYRAPDGTVWSTEHGPSSGDELNKINIGVNYGWPHVLYGTSYGAKIFQGGFLQDDHGDYEHPVFAWMPAVAVSNLIGVEGDLFPLWKGDLLVSSLKARKLFRLQMYEGRVVYSEAIKIGRRIRDLVQTPNGEIFLWTDNQSLVRLRNAASADWKKQPLAIRGERLFQEKCAACHNVSSDVTHGIGPSLHNVYANKVARHRDYYYSEALRAYSREFWSRENLDPFLKDPSGFSPGTTMQMQIPDDEDRRALIHYLRHN